MSKEKLKQGEKLVVIANRSGHGQPNGTKLTFKQYNGNGCNGTPGILVNENSSWYDQTDIKLMVQTIEQLNDEITEVKEKIAEHELEVTNIQSKIDYLNETGSKLFDENEYRAYTTLKTLEGDGLSTLQKAIKIASIFNN